MPLQFEKINSTEFKKLPPRQTVFFFPVGPMEDHGPHLPLGFDLEEAYGVCELSSQRLEREMPGWVGVIMPRCPLGIESNTKQIAITVRPHVLRDWLVDACRSLIQMGFFHFVCISGHRGPKQLTAIEEAGKIIRRTPKWLLKKNRPELVSAYSALIPPSQQLRSPLWPDCAEHGGKDDTSIALFLGHFLKKDLVDPTYQSLIPIERDDSFWRRRLEFMRGQVPGYWGNPAGADSKTGQEITEHTLDVLFPKLRAVWEGANPESIFRSWYSVFPSNKSFFKSWVLFSMIFLVLVFWTYYSLKLIMMELPG